MKLRLAGARDFDRAGQSQAAFQMAHLSHRRPGRSRAQSRSARAASAAAAVREGASIFFRMLAT